MTQNMPPTHETSTRVVSGLFAGAGVVCRTHVDPFQYSAKAYSATTYVEPTEVHESAPLHDTALSLSPGVGCGLT